VSQALINTIHVTADMNANSHIPDYWSAEQALAVYELLDALREQVWDRYGEQITERMRREYAEQQALAQLELSLDDELPF
jgi:hypothetical protein